LEKACFRCGDVKEASSFHKDRYSSDGYKRECTVCAAERRKDYYKRNKDREGANKRKWDRENIERVRQLKRESRQRRVQTAQGRAIRRAEGHRRRTVTLNANSGCWYAREQYAIFIRNDWCSYCGSTNKLSLDHIDPISKSFDDSWSNLTTACLSCNSSKRDRSLLVSRLGKLEREEES